MDKAACEELNSDAETYVAPQKLGERVRVTRPRFGIHGSLPIQLRAPIPEIPGKFRRGGILDSANRPASMNELIPTTDEAMIEWFVSVPRGIPNVYRCRGNENPKTGGLPS